jgi:aspartokinase
VTKIKIGGIMQNDHLARISLMGAPGRADTASVLLNTLGQAEINVQFIVQCMNQHDYDHIVLCIDRDDLARALDLTCQVQAELRSDSASHDPNVASVGIFGPDFRIRPGIAGVFFAALAAAGIPIQAISTSVSTCTVIIPVNRLPDAVTVIQQTFELPMA